MVCWQNVPNLLEEDSNFQSLYVIEIDNNTNKKHGTIKLFIYIQYVTCMYVFNLYIYVCV
jgi:hypothetical protein